MTLHQAAAMTADCAVEHAGWIAVAETFRGQTIWEGRVEIFILRKPPPRYVYAWTVEPEPGEGEPQRVTVLGSDEIDSPMAAVRAWIVSQYKD